MKIPALDKGQIVRHALFAIVMGFVGAGASILLCICIDAAYHVNQAYPWTLFLLPLLGIGSIFLYKALKLNVYLTTGHVIDSMRKNRVVSAFLAPGILLGTCLSVLGGGSVGKESAALQMGASLGETIGKPFKLKAVRIHAQHNVQYGYAAATGMAATFSALFFAPLGSAFFVWELSRFKGSITRHFPSLLLACFIAAGISKAVGIGDIIPQAPIPDLDIHSIFMAVLVSIICGVAGALFGTILRKTQHINERWVKNPYLSILIGGGVFIALVYCNNWTAFEGMGGNLLALAIAGTAGTWDFAIKALLTVIALGFCYKGGEIMPMFTIGTLLGCTLGDIIGISPAFSAALGMATFFCGATRCPLAAFFIGAETFGFGSVPYLAVGVFCAYAASFDFGIYGHGAAREARTRLSTTRFNRFVSLMSKAAEITDPDPHAYKEPFDAVLDPKRFMTKEEEELLAQAEAREKDAQDGHPD